MIQLMRLAARIITKDMTLAPPRHGKSFLRAVLFAAWYLLNNPNHYIVIACNSGKLAEKFSRDIKKIVRMVGSVYGVKVSRYKSATGEWETEQGGGVLAVGVGGQLTGRAAHLMILDDTIKSPDQAMSPSYRQGQWDWYASVSSIRLEPNGIICFTMTPWNEDDLAGRIEAVEADEWDIMKFPAIAEEDDILGRAPGEALWPARYPIEQLLKIEKRDPYWFHALYQLRPRPRGGLMFLNDWFTGDRKVFTFGPRQARRVRYWDKASSKNKGDWTAGVRMAFWGRTAWIEDVKRFRLASHARDKEILEVCRMDNRDFENMETAGEQEPGGGGKESAEDMAKLLWGYKVFIDRSNGGKSKAARAEPMARQCAAGNVYICDGPWNNTYVKELTGFPGSSPNDDQVDASSGAFNRLYLRKAASGQFVSNGKILVPKKYKIHAGGFVS